MSGSACAWVLVLDRGAHSAVCVLCGSGVVVYEEERVGERVSVRYLQIFFFLEVF